MDLGGTPSYSARNSTWEPLICGRASGSVISFWETTGESFALSFSAPPELCVWVPVCWVSDSGSGSSTSVSNADLR